jgi:glycosyltransferase involved in cell wall biosynthesis
MNPVDRGLAGRTYLSIVIPSYNEEQRLGGTLEKIQAFIEQKNLNAEILVVDDGSADGTVRLAEGYLRGRNGRVLPNGRNRGKGYSVRQGVLQASGRWVLLTDADLSTPIEEYDSLAAVVRDRDLDVAIGSRGLADSRVEVPQHGLRQFMGKTFNRIIRVMTGLPFRDTQCGFKLMDRERCLPLFQRMQVERFAFDVEFLFLCHRYGLQVAEVPVIWRNDEASTVSILADPANMLLDVAKVRWRFRRGHYDPTRAGGDR